VEEEKVTFAGETAKVPKLETELKEVEEENA